MEQKEKKVQSKDKKNKGQDYSIRTINIKLENTEELAQKFDENIEAFSELTDIGVNRYANLEEYTKENITQEAKNMRKELKKEGVRSGTFVDLAIGRKGAESHFNTIRKMAREDIRHRNKELKKIEKENPNLLKLKNVYFPPVKNMSGVCTMCGREGRVFYKGVEPQYEEYLCEVCAVDFFIYREPLKTLNRHIKKNYPLCKELLSEEKFDLSEGLKREISRIGKKKEDYKKTVSNKFKIKKNQLKMEFDPNFATITLMDGSKPRVGFTGDYYINKFPKYGKFNDVNFRKLIEDHLKGGGYSFLIRRTKVDGSKEYYLSIPTHYPMINKEKKIEFIKGCILVSQRRVLIYIKDHAKFIELYNPYLKKRKFEKKQKEIQQENADLCLCDWNKIPEKNHKFLINLREKLGFDWVKEYDVTVSKSEDTNRVWIQDDSNIKRKIEIILDKEKGLAELNGSDGTSHKLFIVERKKKLDKKEKDTRVDRVSGEIKDKYRKMELYVSPQIPLPKKYAHGNLLKHIRHKNKETARKVVEEAKKLLAGDIENSSIVLVDYTKLHTEKEAIVPITSLNDQIRNMLMYDSIYAGSINWNHLKILHCPVCGEELDEKSKGRVADKGRLHIRDILLSGTNTWICENEICKRKINSPLIAIARNIMRGNMKKFLEKYKKKSGEDEENEVIENSIRDILYA
jgi:hypothetical protein